MFITAGRRQEWRRGTQRCVRYVVDLAGFLALAFFFFSVLSLLGSESHFLRDDSVLPRAPIWSGALPELPACEPVCSFSGGLLCPPQPIWLLPSEREMHSAPVRMAYTTFISSASCGSRGFLLVVEEHLDSTCQVS